MKNDKIKISWSREGAGRCYCIAQLGDERLWYAEDEDLDSLTPYDRLTVENHLIDQITPKSEQPK